MGDEGYISADAWAKGIGYSILASVVGGASKLAIRKSWLMVQPNNVSGGSSIVASSSSSSFNPDSDNIHNEQPSTPYRLDDNQEDRSTLEMVGGNAPSDSGTSTLAALTKSPIEHSNSGDSLRQRYSYCANEDQLDDQKENQLASNMQPTVEKETHAKDNNATALCLRYSGMFGMTILNPLFCVLAMNYASPSILAPFSGLTLVWIILFSEQIISERPQVKQIIAASLIILGQVVVGVFGDHTNDDGITLEEVEASYKQLSFQLFFVGMAMWLSFLTYLMVYPPTPTLRRFAWGVASGSITGFQNFLKDSLSVSKACKANGESLPLYFYILASFAALTAFSGLLILTRCMKRYDATFSSAMFVGSFIIIASIMSDIHYHTFENLVGMINYIMYPSGLGILMVGLYLLVQDTEEPVLLQSSSDVGEEHLDNSSNPPDLRLPLVSTSKDEEDMNRLT